MEEGRNMVRKWMDLWLRGEEEEKRRTREREREGIIWGGDG